MINLTMFICMAFKNKGCSAMVQRAKKPSKDKKPFKSLKVWIFSHHCYWLTLADELKSIC